jgi:hypothetical protein
MIDSHAAALTRFTGVATVCPSRRPAVRLGDSDTYRRWAHSVRRQSVRCLRVGSASLRRVVACASLLVALSLAALAGCTQIQPIKKLPLSVPTLAKNSVVLDVLFVRFPAGDKDLNGPVWQEIDELHFSADDRRRLASNGLRAGVISGPLPLKIESLLKLTDKPSPEVEEAGEQVDIERTPVVKQRQLRVQAGRRSNIITMGETERVPEMSLLLCGDDGQVKGRTFRDVMGLFALRSFPQGDGGVRLEFVPELEHGSAQKKFVPGDGMFKVEFGPPHEVIDDLKLSAVLTTGQFLAVSCVPQRSGSLGYRFFTEEKGDAAMQKLLLIRLVHCEIDDRFNDTTPSPTDGGIPDDVKTTDVNVLTHENSSFTRKKR